jgi:hypothetical protein
LRQPELPPPAKRHSRRGRAWETGRVRQSAQSAPACCGGHWKPAKAQCAFAGRATPATLRVAGSALQSMALPYLTPPLCAFRAEWGTRRKSAGRFSDCRRLPPRSGGRWELWYALPAKHTTACEKARPPAAGAGVKGNKNLEDFYCLPIFPSRLFPPAGGRLRRISRQPRAARSAGRGTTTATPQTRCGGLYCDAFAGCKRRRGRRQ